MHHQCLVTRWWTANPARNSPAARTPNPSSPTSCGDAPATLPVIPPSNTWTPLPTRNSPIPATAYINRLLSLGILPLPAFHRFVRFMIIPQWYPSGKQLVFKPFVTPPGEYGCTDAACSILDAENADPLPPRGVRRPAGRRHFLRGLLLHPDAPEQREALRRVCGAAQGYGFSGEKVCRACRRPHPQEKDQVP